MPVRHWYLQALRSKKGQCSVEILRKIYDHRRNTDGHFTCLFYKHAKKTGLPIEEGRFMHEAQLCVFD
jgi:hypothetical protein